MAGTVHDQQRYPLRDGAPMRVLELIAPVFLVIIAACFAAHVGRARAADLACTQLSNGTDDGAPLAARLTAPAITKIEPVQAETACRSALAADPSNSSFMFLLGRALSLGSKRLEAISYYLNAADRGHAGAMNDLGGVFEYGIWRPRLCGTKEPQSSAMRVQRFIWAA
jgi:TPR repeat protein